MFSNYQSAPHLNKQVTLLQCFELIEIFVVWVKNCIFSIICKVDTLILYKIPLL
jgi:hypothetical protein